MKIFRQLALVAALVSGAANHAAGQAISNVLIPPQTIVGNLQGSTGGASALRLCDVAVALSQTGYLISSFPISCNTQVPPPTRTPGNALVWGPSPTQNIIADAGGPPLLSGGALGTPSSIVLTNGIGLPVSSGLTGLAANIATWLGAASSANLRAAVTDETGTGSLYFQGGDIGTPSAGNGSNLTALNAAQLTAGTLPPARLGLGQLTNSLGADVALNNTANYFDGPSVAQGSTGTWFATGTVTLQDPAGAQNFYCKLWDGTTVMASGNAVSAAASARQTISLSGVLASPAGNLRISCRDPGATTGVMEFNRTGNSKDSTITVFRIN